MSKKVKIALAIGLQLGMIGAIGDFVGWRYMRYVFIAMFVAFACAFVFFMYDMIKE